MPEMRRNPGQELLAAELAKIEAQATTPLKSDQSDQVFFTWINPRERMPDNHMTVLICGVQGEKVVGEFDHISDCWLTDVGRLDRTQVAFWAIIPDVKS